MQKPLARGFPSLARTRGPLAVPRQRPCSSTQFRSSWVSVAHATHGPALVHGSAEVPLITRFSALLPQLLGRTLSPFQGFLRAKLGRPRLNCGCRIGEASHPGPGGQRTITSFFGDKPEEPAFTSEAPPDTCVFAVVNPTSVLNKAHAFAHVGADVLALSETSAVAQVQKITGKAMHRHGYRLHWGAPVPSHQREFSVQTCLRGLAAGVALASRLPSRSSQPGLEKEALETCRLSEAFVRFGALEVRVLTVYGFPLSHLDAREKTEHLLHMVCCRVTQNHVPRIIAGDFNQTLDDLPSGQALLGMGYRNIFCFAPGCHRLRPPAHLQKQHAP